jgi:general secretion pathway protein D
MATMMRRETRPRTRSAQLAQRGSAFLLATLFVLPAAAQRVQPPRPKTAGTAKRGRAKLPPPGATPAPGAADAQATAATAPEAGAAAAAAAGDRAIVPGEKEFNECVKYPRRQRLKVTLKPDSELSDLVNWISSMTCKRFILPSSVRSQKVTLISPTAVTPGTAYRAFLSALDAIGLTVVPTPGGYLKVVQGNWANQSPIPTFSDDERSKIPRSDAMVTHIAHIRNVDVNEMMLVLNKMKSRSGDVTAYRPTNTLIITDNAANIRRMRGIVDELDVATAGEKIWVVRLRTADAEEVLKILNQVFQQQKGKNVRQPVKPKPPQKGKKPAAPAAPDDAEVSVSKMVADSATNSLILVASPSSFSRIASLIKKLDVEGEGVSERIHVYYLENGDAEEIAQTLSSLTSGQAGRARRTNRRGGNRSGSTDTATLFEGDVKVTSDKATNSLVIVASTKDYLSLRRVVKKLDIPRRQVFVEAFILEVSLNKERTIGVSVHGGNVVGSGDSESILFGGLFPSQEFNSLLLNPAALTGLAAGARGALLDGSAELLGLETDIPGFGVLLQLLQTNNNLNVLSAPHILTTDNQEAEITVGQNLPFQGSFVGSALQAAGGAAGAAASFLPQISVQRQDVALNLKLTPHVNESDMVRLEVEQEVSDIVAENFNQLGPATSKRSVKTAVVVRDQQTVVIGGLMADQVRDEEAKIPLLGDIPIIGYLFKRNKKSLRKTNLMLILTPYVIRDQSDLRRIFRQKIKERREFIERYTAFEPRDVAHEVDYRHKRGLLGEIHRVGLQAEQEADLLRQARRATEEPVDPVEMPDDLSSRTSSGDSSATAGEPSGERRPPAMPPSARAPTHRVELPDEGSVGGPPPAVR